MENTNGASTAITNWSAQSPVSRLDALLRTEEIAQIAAGFAVLGPPDALYRKIGLEDQHGHSCDLYEARFPGAGPTTVARVWINPRDGLPVRVVRGQLDADGKLSPEIELTDVAINVPLPDDLFRFDGSGHPQAVGTPALAEETDPPALDLAPTVDASGQDLHCEVWHTLRISDTAALIIWRRSAPAAKADETADWLSGITIAVSDPHGDRELRHHWVYQSQAADRWNWSLVVPADGKPLGRAEINLKVSDAHSLTTMGLTPLRLPEQDLRELLRTAQSAMLPANSPEVSLPYLQAVGAKLTSGGH